MSELVKVTLAAGEASYSGDAPSGVAAALAKLIEQALAAAEARRLDHLVALAAEKADALVMRACEQLARGDLAGAARYACDAQRVLPEHEGAARLLAEGLGAGVTPGTAPTGAAPRRRKRGA